MKQFGTTLLLTAQKVAFSKFLCNMCFFMPLDLEEMLHVMDRLRCWWCNPSLFLHPRSFIQVNGRMKASLWPVSISSLSNIWHKWRKEVQGVVDVHRSHWPSIFLVENLPHLRSLGASIGREANLGQKATSFDPLP